MIRICLRHNLQGGIDFCSTGDGIQLARMWGLTVPGSRVAEASNQEMCLSLVRIQLRLHAVLSRLRLCIISQLHEL